MTDNQVSLDRLKFADKLRAVGCSEDQAEIALATVYEALHSQPATKSDINNFPATFRRKLRGLYAMLLGLGVLVALAITGVNYRLQAQIDTLQAQQASLASVAEEALSAATAAESKASNVEAAARRAAAASEEVNAKLDKIFKRKE